LKRFTASLVPIALVTSPLLAQEPEAWTATQDGTPIRFGTTHQITSAVLDEERTVNVWLPPGHETAEEAYTVLYLIDGGVEQDFPHIAGLAQLGVISWQYAPLIVVGIETGDRLHELTPEPADPRYSAQFEAAGGAAEFRAYIANDVIPFIEASYRVGGRRAVIGESLAGLFIVDTLLEQPDLFDDYISVSPSLWWDDQAVAERAVERLGAADYSATRVYLTMGDEGGTMQAGLDTLLAALDAVEDAPDYRYVDRRETETHSTIYHGAALDALRWLYSRPPYDYGEIPWYLIEGGQPDDGPDGGSE
jgi:hypothetical protein